MRLNRDAIQRMINIPQGSGSVGIGGEGGSLAGLATEAWVEENYLSKAFFTRLFKAYGPAETEGDPDVEVEPNDLESDITSIEAMFGFWTEQYISALGQGSGGGGGGGGSDTLAGLIDVELTNPVAGQVLKYNGTKWINAAASAGTVTSVALSVPTGFNVTGSPITSAGVLGFTFATGYSLPTTASQTNWDAAYSWTSQTRTTLADYGITDAKFGTPGTDSIPITLGSTTQSVLTQHQSLANYYTKSETDGKFLTISFFRSLFKAYNSSDVEVQPNDGSTSTIASIKAMFGFWTEQYISALGQSSGGGGGVTLNQPLLGINQAGLSAPTTAGQILVYNGTKWAYAGNINITNLTAYAGTFNSTVTAVGSFTSQGGNFIAQNGGFKINGYDDTYVLLAGGGKSKLKTVNGYSLFGDGNIEISGSSIGSVKVLANYYDSRPTSANVTFGDGGLRFFEATSSMTTGKPSGDASVIHLAWDNTGGWDSQLAVTNGAYGKIQYREQTSGTWSDWKTVIDSNNFTSWITPSSIGAASSSDLSNYLPLSGGTIRNTSTDTPLVIRSGYPNTYIGFEDSNGSRIGYLAVRSDNNPYFYYSGTNYKIWTAGNDGSGSGLDADLLDGHDSSYFATSDGYLKVLTASAYNANTQYNAGLYLFFNGTNAPTGYGSLLVLPYRTPYNNTNTDYVAQIFLQTGDGGNNMYYRTSTSNTWNSWKTVATTDGNIASATKLNDNSEHKAWGQTFWNNGQPVSGDVSGNMTGVGSINASGNIFITKYDGYVNITSSSANESYCFGASVSGYIWGTTYGRYLTFLDGSVGVSKDSPNTNYKLDVNGKIIASDNITVYKSDGNFTATSPNANESYMFGASTSGYIYGNVKGRYMTFYNGYVGVGANAPSYQLDVFGNAQFGAHSNRKVRIGSTSDYASISMVASDGSTSIGVMTLGGVSTQNVLRVGNGGYELQFRGSETYFNYGTSNYSALSINSSGYVTVYKRIYLSTDVYLEYDSTNGSVKLNGSIYATGSVSALGSSSSGTTYLDQATADARYIRLTTSQTVSGAKTFSGGITMTSNITPSTTQYYSVGTSDKRFASMYATNMYANVLSIYNGSTYATLNYGSHQGSLNSYIFTTNTTPFVLDTGTAIPYYTKAWQARSDMRRKIVVNYINMSIDDIANAPIFNFKWIDQKDNSVSIGTSAQYWQNYLPTAVSATPDGYLAMDYVDTALVAAIITARKVQSHEERIAALEAENARLQKEINELKTA